MSLTLRLIRVKIVAAEKAISITYSECVFVALVIQRAMRMHRIILPSVVCLAVQYFCTLSHERHDFRKNKIIEHKIYFHFLYKFV